MIIDTHLAVKTLFSGFSLYTKTVKTLFTQPKGENSKKYFPCIEIAPGPTEKNDEFESEAYEYSVEDGSGFDVYAIGPRHYNLNYEIHTHVAGKYSLRDEATLLEDIIEKVGNYGLITIEGNNYKYDLTDFEVVSRGTNEDRTFHQLAMLTVFQQILRGTPESLPAITEDGKEITQVEIPDPS